MIRCEACGAEAVDLDLDEPVCTECATLHRGGLVRLVNTEDYEGRYAQDSVPNYAPLQALKSVRNDGWDIAGQGSMPTNERNLISMNKFIQSLANILGHPGVAARAQYLFARAREHPDTSIRWGKAAEVCAGAALFVALRAEGYSDRTDEIAARLNVDAKDVSRVLLRFLKQDDSAVWNVRLAPSTADKFLDATLHFLCSDAATLSAETSAFVRPLLPSAHRAILKTAHALYEDVMCPCATPDEIERAPAVAAAALVMLALEGHAGKPAPQVLKLATTLGSRSGVGVLGPAVMERYRRALDALETRAKGVPFINVHAPKSGRQRGGAKTDARRAQLARVARDVLAFFASERARGVAKAEAEIVFPSWEDGEGDEKSDGDTGSGRGIGKRAAPDCDANCDGPRKRPRQGPRTAHGRARAFLLDPSNGAEAPCLFASSYLLAPQAHPGKHAPTRLQQLSAMRGGGDAVEDEELFAEGELEDMIMCDDEDEAMDRRRVLDALIPVEEKKHVEQVEKRLTPEERAKRRGLGRMNVEALRRVLGEDGLSGEDTGSLDGLELLRWGEDHDWVDEGGSDEEEKGYVTTVVPRASGHEEVVGEWRPPSPGVGGTFGWDGDW
ncbi:hypothetical protein PENSPDRAFT_751449 [Peniophora sp. CONT]|nr:hypothetical protein PENSPDRAFT_751449 [Peniophora sp. CONT]